MEYRKLDKNQAEILSLEEYREFNKRRKQRGVTLFIALGGLSVILYIISLIHL